MNTLLVQSAVPPGRMFALDQQTLISTGILLFNFCLLALLLGRILYRPMQKYLLARTERISGQLEDAQDKMSKADALKAEYEAKLAEIAAERAATLEAAQLEAAERARRVLDEARAEAETIRRGAEARIQESTEQAKRELQRQVVEISSVMAEKLVRKTMDDEAHDRLFAEALAELEETPWPT